RDGSPLPLRPPCGDGRVRSPRLRHCLAGHRPGGCRARISSSCFSGRTTSPMTTTEPGAATTSRTGDPAGLGRGPLTRRLPVWWQAEAAPPTAIPYPVDGTTRASRFLLRVLFSAPALTVPAAALGVL